MREKKNVTQIRHWNMQSYMYNKKKYIIWGIWNADLQCKSHDLFRSISMLSTIFRWDFGTVPTVWYILFFILFPHSLPNSRTAVWFWSLMTFILFWFSLVLIRKKTFEEELITKHPEERCFFLTWRLLYQHSLNSFLSLLCLVLIVILCEPMNSFLLCLSFLWNEIKNGPMKK